MQSNRSLQIPNVARQPGARLWIVLALASSLAACSPDDGSGPGPNPAPSLTTLSPATAGAGAAAFTLTVNGSNFTSQSVARWNGADRATTVVNSSQLTAAILASDVVSVGVSQVTVFTPSPGGGVSAGLDFAVVNPTPTVTSLFPGAVTAGAAAFTLSVNGSNFTSQSVVRWNGVDRPTTVVNSSQLTAAIPASDLVSGGLSQVTVFTPSPGGGVSTARVFAVLNPTPSITSLSPANALAGAAAFTLTVNGSYLTSQSVVRWNGDDRATTFVNSGQLTAAILAGDLASPSTMPVTVFNPGPGGGVSTAFGFIVCGACITSQFSATIQANDILYDPLRQQIYASVASTDPSRGNTVAVINPATGAIVSSVFVGSEPQKLAMSDDAQFLYVALGGAAAVRRVDLATMTAGLQFPVGSDPFFGLLYVEDMEVLPGAPHSVAVSRRNQGFSPRHEGVAIYDDGITRPTVTPVHTGSNVIAFSESAATLYGYDNESTDFGFRRMLVTPSGVTVATVQSGLISGFGVDIAFDGGRIFSSTGAVVDPASGTLAGTFATTGFVRPDVAKARVFFLQPGEQTVMAFDATTFTPAGSVSVPGVSGAAGSFIRWGVDGLAFRTAQQVVMIRTTLIPQ